MQEQFLVGILLGVLAGVVNGVFLLPMRYTRHWAWENTWLLFTIFSTGLFPWIAALVGVPHVWDVLRASPVSFLLPGIVAGLVWGVAQVMYGQGLGMVGVAIGSAVVGCTSTTFGTIGPMIVYGGTQVSRSAVIYLLLAVGLILAGILIYGRSGARKEREVAGKEQVKQVVQGSFKSGLAICLVTGALGTAFVYGSKSSTSLVEAALAAGATSRLTAEFVALLVTFNAGMIPGIIFSWKVVAAKGARARAAPRPSGSLAADPSDPRRPPPPRLSLPTLAP